MSDRGAQITYHISGKDYDLGSPIHKKKIRYSWLIFRQYEQFETTIDLSAVVDYTSRFYEDKSMAESMIWDKSDWSEGKWDWIDTATLPVKISKKGLRCRIEATGHSDDTFQNEIFLYGFAFEYKTKKPTK
jgi:hypothetical protein